MFTSCLLLLVHRVGFKKDDDGILFAVIIQEKRASRVPRLVKSIEIPDRTFAYPCGDLCYQPYLVGVQTSFVPYFLSTTISICISIDRN